METDEQLIQRAADGEKVAFQDLILRYQSKVYAVAYKVTKNQKDAEDIAQEVFLQLYRSLSQFQGDSTFSTWIYKISMNKALDYKRKMARTPSYQHEEISANLSTKDTPENSLIKKEERELAHDFVEHLPPNYQDVVNLYYFQQQSYHEIANQLDIAVKTVESRLYRAKIMMRKYGKEQNDETYYR